MMRSSAALAVAIDLQRWKLKAETVTRVDGDRFGARYNVAKTASSSSAHSINPYLIEACARQRAVFKSKLNEAG